MFLNYRRTYLIRLLGLFLIVFLTAVAGVTVFAQDKDDEDIEVVTTVEDEPPPPPVSVRNGDGFKIGDRNVDDSTTGSIVRGRAFYEDTGKPVRRGWIGFIKIRELVEKKTQSETREIYTVSSSGGVYSGTDKYVLTDDDGEFVIKGVKAGIYLATFKVKGVLNPDISDRQNPLFQQIAVDGTNEVQVSVGVKRGGAISGRILYPDGEPVIGARVQIFKKQERLAETSSSYISPDSLTVTVTDDRGFYRFPGLPADEYFVRVIEPSIHNESGKSVSGYDVAQYGSGSELKTFFPSVSNMKDAKAVAVVLGQEQAEVDIHIPDRRLFRISGTVVAKNNKNPLKGYKVWFEKIPDGSVNNGLQINNYSYDRTKQTATDASGVWAFRDLPKGKYRVTVSLDDQYSSGYFSTSDGVGSGSGGGTQQQKKDEQPKYAPLAKEIEIDDRDLPDLVFELAPEASISGTVIVEGEKPFPNFVGINAVEMQKKINSFAYISSNRNAKNAQSGNAGNQPKTFRIGKLSEGKFVLNVGTEPGYYIKSLRKGSSDLLNSPVELKDGEELTGVQIVLGTDVGILKGKLSGYQAGERAFVVLIPASAATLGISAMQRGAGGIVKPTGEFEVKAAPGEYLVIVGTDKNRPNPTTGNLDEWFKNLIKDARRATLRAGETETISLDYPD